MKEFLLSNIPIIRFVLIFAVVLYLIKAMYDKIRMNQLESNPDSLPYLFKKYPKLKGKDGDSELFRLLNDPGVPQKDRDHLSQIHELLGKLNSKPSETK